jgi:bifunctional non-homologous end joining protein LigD
VVAPLRRGPDSNTVRTRAGELAEELAGRLPDQLTTSWRKEGRGGRVLVDAARNTYAQTAVAPYAVRAKNGAPVATPLFWDEVETAEPRRWTLRDVPDRLEERGDPWEDIASAAARLPS